jgi:hypothetical protein
MLGKKELETIQSAFVIDVLEYFCSFHLLQKHLLSQIAKAQPAGITWLQLLLL